MPTLADTDFTLFAHADITKFAQFNANNLTTGTTSTIKLPATGGSNPATLAALELSQTFTGGCTFDDTVTAAAPIGAVISNPGANQSLISLFVTSSGNAFDIVIPSSGFTGSRAITLPDASGTIALTATSTQIAATVNLTVQSADIASTTLTSTAGYYRVGYVLETTTADVTAGIVTLTIGYTDDAGATTSTATRTLATTGRTTGSVDLYLASGNLTYAITHTGAYGTSKYALRLRVEAL